LPQLNELIGEGLVILDDVEVIHYIGRASDRPRKERRRWPRSCWWRSAPPSVRQPAI
jgi:hypothetical protein